MKVIIENLTTGEAAEVIKVPLPEGGDVRVGETRTFRNIDTKTLEYAEATLNELIADEKITVNVLPDDHGSDHGKREYCRVFILEAVADQDVSDFTDGDTAQAFTDTYVFPDGAVQTGFSVETEVAFATPNTFVADIGYNGASEGDLLLDGVSVKAAANLPGSGANATPTFRRKIGGKSIKASFTSGDINMSALTAGRIRIRVFFRVY
jgi:hypothetical protein